jgi:alkaline phosphatase
MEEVFMKTRERCRRLLNTSFTILFFIVFCRTVFAAIPTDKYIDTARGPNVRNVIIMIADGCGYNHVNAASIYRYGTDGAQVYEKFPVRLGMSTYQAAQGYDPQMAWKYFDYVNLEYTDSSAAATAMACGVKTYDGAIGVDVDGFQVENILERAEAVGKSTGVVTSVQFSHATPACFVAHNVSRDDYEHIAAQMVNDSAVDVIMGCGHPWYDRNGQLKSTPNGFDYVGGSATWDSLVAGTAGSDADGDGVVDPWHLIQSRSEFQTYADWLVPAPKRLVGVPQVYRTLQQERSGDAYAAPHVVPLLTTVPTLTEMTKAALNVLDADNDGFYLVIEGGAVDWAAHANQSGRTIEEQIEFGIAVEAVVEWVQTCSSWSDTLLIVTADHETGYMTGPGSGSFDDGPVWNPLVNNGAEVLPGMQWNSGSHTNSLVPFYAKGKGAILFFVCARNKDPVRGRYLDNTDIAKTLFRFLR